MNFFHVAFFALAIGLVAAVDYGSIIEGIADVRSSRQRAVEWMVSQFDEVDGWPFGNTHRAIAALYLADSDIFVPGDTKSRLMTKQLELELALALYRNRTDPRGQPVSAGQLALYVNALVAVCRNVRNFRGAVDIVNEIQSRSLIESQFARGLVTLAMCNAKEQVDESTVEELKTFLQEQLPGTRLADTEAMVTMALSCILRGTAELEASVGNTVEKFKRQQREDGSFGNVYTSAVVIQSLIASESSLQRWNFTAAINYLLSQQGTAGAFSDLLGTYFVLPVLKGFSLAHLRNRICRQMKSYAIEAEQSSGAEDSAINVRYGLRVGDGTNFITMEKDVRAKKNDTFFKVMQTASASGDPNYAFTYEMYSFGPLITSIGNFANDDEAHRYWMLYKEQNGSLKMTTVGAGTLIVENNDHIVFWYKKVEV